MTNPWGQRPTPPLQPPAHGWVDADQSWAAAKQKVAMQYRDAAIADEWSYIRANPEYAAELRAKRKAEANERAFMERNNGKTRAQVKAKLDAEDNAAVAQKEQADAMDAAATTIGLTAGTKVVDIFKEKQAEIQRLLAEGKAKEAEKANANFVKMWEQVAPESQVFERKQLVTAMNTFVRMVESGQVTAEELTGSEGQAAMENWGLSPSDIAQVVRAVNAITQTAPPVPLVQRWGLELAGPAPTANPFIQTGVGLGPTWGTAQAPKTADWGGLVEAGTNLLGTINKPFQYQSAVYHGIGPAPGTTKELRLAQEVTKPMSRERAQMLLAKGIDERNLPAVDMFFQTIENYEKADIPLWERVIAETSNPLLFVSGAQLAVALGLSAKAVKAATLADTVLATGMTLGMNKLLPLLIRKGSPIAAKIAGKKVLTAAEKAEVEKALDDIVAEARPEGQPSVFEIPKAKPPAAPEAAAVPPEAAKPAAPVAEAPKVAETVAPEAKYDEWAREFLDMDDETRSVAISTLDDAERQGVLDSIERRMGQIPESVRENVPEVARNDPAWTARFPWSYVSHEGVSHTKEKTLAQLLFAESGRWANDIPESVTVRTAQALNSYNRKGVPTFKASLNKEGRVPIEIALDDVAPRLGFAGTGGTDDLIAHLKQVRKVVRGRIEEENPEFTALLALRDEVMASVPTPEATMAPGTSVQAGLAGMEPPKPPQVKMFGEFGGAPGTGGSAPGLMDKAALEAAQAAKPLPGQGGLRDLGKGAAGVVGLGASAVPTAKELEEGKGISPWVALPIAIASGIVAATVLGARRRPVRIPTTQPVAVQKLVAALNLAKPALRETRQLQHEALQAKSARMAAAIREAHGMGSLPQVKATLAGELPKADFTIPPELRLTQAEVDSMTDQIWTFPQWERYSMTKGNAAEALLKIAVNDQLPQKAELRLLATVFGPELQQAIWNLRPLSERTWASFMDAINLPRMIQAGFLDMSAALRQGVLLVAGHPLMSGPAWKSMAKAWVGGPMPTSGNAVKRVYKAWMSDANAEAIDNAIRSRPHFQESQELKRPLYFSEVTPGGVARPATEREESFMSSLAEKIPGIKQSGRGFSTFLNDSVSRIWEDVAARGHRLNLPEQYFQDMADTLNIARGRGTLGKLEEAGPILNSLFYSPRLIMARLQTPVQFFKLAMPAIAHPRANKGAVLAWKESARQIAGLIGSGTALLTTLQMTGVAKVELDSRSANYGKLKIGDTYIDVWGGFVQYVRYINQMVRGERKTQSGMIVPQNRAETFLRLFRGKLSPQAAFMVDTLAGEDFLGEDMSLTPDSLKAQAYNRLAPMFIQDFVDAIRSDGLVGGLMASMGFLGVGISSYVSDLKKARNDAAQKAYGMSWEEVGRLQGIAAQNDLDARDAGIQAVLEAEDKKYATALTGVTDPVSLWHRDGIAIRRQFKNDIGPTSDAYKKAKILEQQRDPRAWVGYKDAIQDAALVKRAEYAKRDTEPLFAAIVDFYKQPLTEEQKATMNVNDLAYDVYVRTIADAPDLEKPDAFGVKTFDFKEYDRRIEAFKVRYGTSVWAYVKKRNADLTRDFPKEYQEYQEAKELLKPYWNIPDLVIATMKKNGARNIEANIKEYEAKRSRYPSDSKMLEDLRLEYANVIDYYEMVDGQKEVWRRKKANQQGEDYLVKFYGNVPIKNQPLGKWLR